MNSSGIALIIGILTESRKAHQRMLFAGLSPHYQKIFAMMGLSRYASIFETEADARRSAESVS